MLVHSVLQKEAQFDLRKNILQFGDYHSQYEYSIFEIRNNKLDQSLA